MLNYKEIYKISKIVHQNNIDAGWWKTDRPFSLFSNLIHTEISEAVEGDRKSLKDDHLTQYDMTLAELSDTAIRIMDYLAYLDCKFNTFVPIADLNCKTLHDFLAEIHYHISQAYYYSKEKNKNQDLMVNSLLEALRYTILTSKSFYPEIEFKQVIYEKIEYNLKRKDHSLEERNKTHGKKY